MMLFSLLPNSSQVVCIVRFKRIYKRRPRLIVTSTRYNSIIILYAVAVEIYSLSGQKTTSELYHNCPNRIIIQC